MNYLALVLVVPITLLLGGLPAHAYSAQDAQHGARVRAEASVVLQYLRQPCLASEVAAVKARIEELDARYQAAKDSVADLPLSVDLLIAEADHDYAMSLIDISCPDPANPAMQETALFQLDVADQALVGLEKAIEAAVSEKN